MFDVRVEISIHRCKDVSKHYGRFFHRRDEGESMLACIVCTCNPLGVNRAVQTLNLASVSLKHAASFSNALVLAHWHACGLWSALLK